MDLAAEYAKNCVPFKQRSLNITDQEVAYGVCVGLSADWIARHKNFKSEGSQKRIAFIAAHAKASSIGRQKAYLTVLKASRSGAAGGQTTEIDAALAEVECGLAATCVDSSGYTDSSADDSLHPLYTHTSGLNNYYMILLSFGGDHHCIAAYHSSGKLFGYGSHLYVFEPNFGEIKIAGSETAVKGFFKALAAAYMGYVTRAGAASPKKLDRVTINTLADAFGGSRGRSATVTSRR